MASSEVLSQTLYTITNIKLDQLAKQKAAYESAKRALLQKADDETHDSKRAKILVAGAGDLPSMTPITGSSAIPLHTFRTFLEQAEHDPSVSEELILQNERALRNELNIHSEKYRFAELYGKLVQEWISAGEPPKGPTADDDAASVASNDTGFVPIGRAEMHKQRATWEEYVFKEKHTSSQGIKTYLTELFCEGSDDVQKAFKKLGDRLKSFQKRWDSKMHFDVSSLENCIHGLLRSDLLNDKKRAILNDFLNNKVVLQEIADVLNMRMQTRKSWAWDGDCIVEQRRMLNGRYRFYPDEDLLQSIFLYYIGRSWGVEIRRAFVEFLDTPRVMMSPVKPMSKEDARRRRYFLAESSPQDSVKKALEKHFRDDILLDQLPHDMKEQRGAYNNDGDDTNEDDTRASHTDVVQDLLHILQSVILMQNRIGNEVTVIRSDFKWFGPSLPHSTIFAVLEFFGVNSSWIDFFRTTLECPLRFQEDPAGTSSQPRKRGLALSTPLADFFAESVLFCLDFAVNQKADGIRLYRLHDDMWLWDSEQRCAKAWSIITAFTHVMGLDLNEDKTGCVTVVPRERRAQQQAGAPSYPGLPEGKVTWGFLQLDQATGRFLLDQAKVDEHIEELRLQLKACRSVFDWIQAWNIYGSRFFTNNFGSLANVSSRAHVDSILRTFRRIQDSLFPDVRGGVGGRLSDMIAERFGIDDVPDGYLYFPSALGGLGLQNPFISRFMYRGDVCEDANTLMDEFFKDEKEVYDTAKATYEETFSPAGGADKATTSRQRRSRGSGGGSGAEFADLRDEPFFSFEEFSRHREEASLPFYFTLHRLRAKPTPSVPTTRIQLTGQRPPGWAQMGDYERWVCMQHSGDMLSRFGGMVIVEKGLLPMGLTEMLRQSRFTWQT